MVRVRAFRMGENVYYRVYWVTDHECPDTDLLLAAGVFVPETQPVGTGSDWISANHAVRPELVDAG